MFDSVKTLFGKKNVNAEEDMTFASGKDFKKMMYYDGDEGSTVRLLLAPDGANTIPLAYMSITDGGREIYYAGFYMEKNLREPTVGVQYKKLSDFEGVMTAYGNVPLLEESSKKVNKRINMLESELIAAKDDLNRTREIRAKQEDAQELATLIDSGAESLQETYFYYILRRDSYEELRRDAGTFVALAQSINITLKSTYAATPEVFMSMLPLNKRFKVSASNGSLIGKDPFKKQIMTVASLSTIYSHTSSEYFHEKGALLGYHLSNGMPFVFDLYDKSHYSYGMIVCGETGYGKSASMKIMNERFINRGYTIVSIDYQINGKAGEYAIPCSAAGGVNFVIGGGDEGEHLNLFEIAADSDRDPDTGIITQTLRLGEKKVELANILLSIAMSSSVENRSDYEAVDVDYMTEIISDAIGDIYKDCGLIEGDASSLYEDVKQDGMFGSVRARKKLPRMKDFYVKLIHNAKENEDPLKERAYSVLKGKFKNWVKELYYCPECLEEFTREQYEALPLHADGKRRVHIHKDDNGKRMAYPVAEIQGSEAYFDYDSSITIEENLPWYNFDISQAPETVRPVLVLVAMNYVMENMVKRNSVDPTKAKKMIFITDEFHKVMRSMEQGVLKAYVSLYRTARKHFVGPVIVTQSINDIARHPEANEIMDSTAVYLLFRHLHTARDYLSSQGLGLTDSEIEGVLSLGGDKMQKRPGECCIFDRATNQVSFVRFKYFEEVEGFMIETDTQKRAALMERLGRRDVF